MKGAALQHTVGIAEMKIANRPEDVLVTYSLGSCIGLALYDPQARIGGLIHCMLPLSNIDPGHARQAPCMFTDSGVPLLIQSMLDAGAKPGRLVAKVAGAAALLNNSNTFRIGERNRVVLRKLLWRHGILIAAEDTGGTAARTMSLHLDSGAAIIRSAGREYELT